MKGRLMDIEKIKSVFSEFEVQLANHNAFAELIPKSVLNVHLVPAFYDSYGEQALKCTVTLECSREEKLSNDDVESIGDAAVNFLYDNGLTQNLEEIGVNDDILNWWHVEIEKSQLSDKIGSDDDSNVTVPSLFDQDGHHFEIEAAWEINDELYTCRWCVISNLLNGDNYERIAGAAGGYSGGGTFELERFYLEEDSNGDVKQIVIEANIDWWHEVSPDVRDVAEAAYKLLLRWNNEDDWYNIDALHLAGANRDHPDLQRLGDMLRLRTSHQTYPAVITNELGLTAFPKFWTASNLAISHSRGDLG